MAQTASLPEKNKYPSIASLVAAILGEWPEHEKFVQASFSDVVPDTLARMEEVAALAQNLVGDETDQYAADYHWMCDNFKAEQF